MNASDWVNSIPGVKPTDQFIALDRRMFEDCVERAIASAPAGQEAAFRAGAEAMQRALADALRDHLNSRAAAIANNTRLPEYPA